LDVKASDSVEVIGTSANGEIPSRLNFDTTGAGNAGTLTINTGQLTVRDGALVSASTSGTGQGGVLNVTADAVEVSGTSSNGQFTSGLYFDARSAANSRGIEIDTGRLVVRDGGQVTVSGTSSQASGNLDVRAGSIFLDTQGKLTATTASGEGGNIRLRVGDSILMRNNSEISTEAGGIGNGGNINIDAGGFVIAILSENSDIVASAIQGRGGSARATATGVLGFREFQGRRTQESDFTASSDLGIDGVVSINTRDDPRLVALPSNFLDNIAIAQNCPSREEQVAQSEFIVTGRGGLPDNPSQVLGSDAVWTDLRSRAAVSGSRGEDAIAPAATIAPHHPTAKGQSPTVEARGWIINEKGEVVLTASAATIAPHSLGLTTAKCRGS
jgi:large exoprotein involved in heme utilization and adhesion